MVGLHRRVNPARILIVRQREGDPVPPPAHIASASSEAGEERGREVERGVGEEELRHLWYVTVCNGL